MRPRGKDLDEGRSQLIDFELSDDGVYSGKCPQGHDVVAVLQCLKHEILYESGAVAFLCGFHREAYTSFAVALERFYEFAIEVFLHELGVGAKEFQRAWKGLSRKSERQLGAFLLLYVARKKSPFPYNLDKLANDRNDVVHNGKIPTKGETQAFARQIFDIIESTTVVLLNEHTESTRMVYVRSVAAMHRKAETTHPIEAQPGPPFYSPSGISVPMMVSLVDKREIPADFETALAALESRLDWYGHDPQGPRAWTPRSIPSAPGAAGPRTSRD